MSVDNTNFLQPAGFRVIINRLRFPNLQYFVQSVTHPSVDTQPGAASYRRIVSVDQIGDKLEYGAVTFNIMLDEDMDAYTEMYNWMKQLVEEKYTPTTEATDTRLSSEHDISLIILNSSNIQQKKIVYKNAFPMSLGEVTLTSTDNDPTVITLPVTFRYTYFEIS